MPEITKKEPTKIKKIEPITNIINFKTDYELLEGD